MMLMPSNNSSFVLRNLALRFPKRIGWLQGPTSWKSPCEYIPYALDNDAFTSWSKGKTWDEMAWRKMLEKASASINRPLWCLVPDVVANKSETLKKWHTYLPEVISKGFIPAIAVQDGMLPKDIPDEAEVIFVGGTTSWKLRTVPMWCKEFKRVHVGRVSGITRLLMCERYGAESCDGSGWFRDSVNGKRIKSLELWLEGKISEHPDLFD